LGNKGNPARKKSPEVALILAWLIPGLGHLYLGRKFKGFVFLILLTLTFIVGWGLSRGQAVSYSDHPYAFFAQIWAGLPTIIVLLKIRYFGQVTLTSAIIPYIDVSLLYTSVAGLLNLLVIQDAFETAVGRISAKPGKGDEEMKKKERKTADRKKDDVKTGDRKEKGKVVEAEKEKEFDRSEGGDEIG
jgi:hypothetical protein